MAGAEKALVVCFALAIITLIGFLLNGGAGSAGQDARGALVKGSAGIGGSSKLGQILGQQAIPRAGDVERAGGIALPRPEPKAPAPFKGTPVSITVPRVVNVGAIADPVTRNQAINQSYAEINKAATRYRGGPNVSNWTTFGQHASREAGTQIRNLDEGLDILNNAFNVLKGITNPIDAVRSIPDVIQALRRVIELVQQDGIFGQLIGLALEKAGIKTADIQALINDLNALNSWTSNIPGVGQYRQAKVALRAVYLSGKLVIAIPSILRSANKVRDNLVKGNREIYENIGPAYAQFLAAANAAPDGIPPRQNFKGDPKGYLSEAFYLYGESKRLGDQIKATDDPKEITRLTALRNEKVGQANLLIGFQEQLVILQPIFDTMQQELKAIAGSMALNDPTGKVPLLPNGGNWGDFYTRIGIDPTKAPKDPTTIRPGNLPPLLPPNDPRFKGTIGDYFNNGLNDPRLHRPPPNISRF